MLSSSEATVSNGGPSHVVGKCLRGTSYHQPVSIYANYRLNIYFTTGWSLGLG